MENSKYYKPVVVMLIVMIVAMLTAIICLSTKINGNTRHIEPMESGIDCTPTDTVDIEQYERRLENMACAIAMVESRCNPNAVNGQYVGWLQISPIMVREANRLLGSELYYMDDRWSVTGSIAIFGTIMNAHNPSLDLRKACEIWNPGAGEWYYDNVLNEYEKIL